MRAHGDSPRNFSSRYLDQASSQISSSHIGGSSRRAALGQVKESCPAGRRATRLRIPKSVTTSPPSPKSFPLALQLL
jgi:hypothetical protein